MKDIQYKLVKFGWRILHFPREIENDFFRQVGVKIGNNCRINSNILTAESYLIEIGDNVTISDHVAFVTHDNSISKIIKGKSDLFGKIKIGNNCFIGSHTVIMYGVTLPDNTIVASGSVVTKSICEENLIIGGNPARIISNWEKFREKSSKYAANIGGLSNNEKCEKLMTEEIKLVSR